MKRTHLAVLTAALMALTPAGSAFGQEEEKPNVDAVMDDIAKVGAETLVTRIAEMRKQVDELAKQAKDLRAQADQLESQSAALKQRIAAVESFTSEVSKAMAPPQEAKPEEKPAEEKPAEPAKAEEKPAEEQAKQEEKKPEGE